MVSNNHFDGKGTHLNCFYLHINFEQKYPKLAILSESGDQCLNLQLSLNPQIDNQIINRL